MRRRTSICHLIWEGNIFGRLITRGRVIGVSRGGISCVQVIHGVCRLCMQSLGDHLPARCWLEDPGCHGHLIAP